MDLFLIKRFVDATPMLTILNIREKHIDVLIIDDL